MTNYEALIIGGGMTAAAVVEGSEQSVPSMMLGKGPKGQGTC
jgi:hypothetical protein